MDEYSLLLEDKLEAEEEEEEEVEWMDGELVNLSRRQEISWDVRREREF